MGIDGIGKPGAGAPGEIGSIGGNSPVDTGEKFELRAPSSTSSADGSQALGRLQRGEISLDEYLDNRVENAVDHLSNKLSVAELQFVRETLREQLSSDPVLVELVRRTTA